MSPETSVSPAVAPATAAPADFSVAPEIAQLAAPLMPALLPGQAGPPDRPRTAGRRAGELTDLAAAPERWWDQVRFDPSGPARIAIPGAGGAWLLVVPPGAAAECDCAYATLIAGEATEDGRPLRPGRVLLHGVGQHGVGQHGVGAHRVLGAGHGYSVSLHSLSITFVVTPHGTPLVPLKEYARIIIAADATGTAALAHS
ncbi:MAG TPA: hypothetical protein VK817_00045 [Trebonia sp.]|nr:hypothetical protein [Trebonia sp.]